MFKLVIWFFEVFVSFCTLDDVQRVFNIFVFIIIWHHLSVSFVDEVFEFLRAVRRSCPEFLTAISFLPFEITVIIMSEFLNAHFLLISALALDAYLSFTASLAHRPRLRKQYAISSCLHAFGFALPAHRFDASARHRATLRCDALRLILPPLVLAGGTPDSPAPSFAAIIILVPSALAHHLHLLTIRA